MKGTNGFSLKAPNPILKSVVMLLKVVAVEGGREGVREGGELYKLYRKPFDLRRIIGWSLAGSSLPQRRLGLVASSLT